MTAEAIIPDPFFGPDAASDEEVQAILNLIHPQDDYSPEKKSGGVIIMPSGEEREIPRLHEYSNPSLAIQALKALRESKGDL